MFCSVICGNTKIAKDSINENPDIHAMPSNELEGLISVADKAVKNDNTVYIMANPKSSKSMDFDFKKGGK